MILLQLYNKAEVFNQKPRTELRGSYNYLKYKTAIHVFDNLKMKVFNLFVKYNYIYYECTTCLIMFVPS